jgi:inorganic pyrophosphatase
MAHFFSVYKDLESAEVVGKGWDGLEEAYTEIKGAVQQYREHVRGQ